MLHLGTRPIDRPPLSFVCWSGHVKREQLCLHRRLCTGPVQCRPRRRRLVLRVQARPTSAAIELPAVAAYLGIAHRHGLNPAQMAIAFCRQRPFPCIPIFGATSLPQLETALGAADLVLSPDVMAEIDTAHRAHPMPY